MKQKVSVVVVMGSQSDLPVMKDAVVLLDDFGIGVQTEIVSAHRTPKLLSERVRAWETSGVQFIIAGAGGAAHLPGMLASFSTLPVIGVPIKGSAMNGLDSLLSIAQMPKGIPVATVAVNNAHNAALLGAQILAAGEGPQALRLRKKIVSYRKNLEKSVMASRKSLNKLGVQKFLKNLN